MHLAPLFEAFLSDLEQKGWHISVRDYQRLHLAFCQHRNWNMAAVQRTIAAILISDPDQSPYFESCFQTFFADSIAAEAQGNLFFCDWQQFLAMLQHQAKPLSATPQPLSVNNRKSLLQNALEDSQPSEKVLIPASDRGKIWRALFAALVTLGLMALVLFGFNPKRSKPASLAHGPSLPLQVHPEHLHFDSLQPFQTSQKNVRFIIDLQFILLQISSSKTEYSDGLDPVIDIRYQN